MNLFPAAAAGISMYSHSDSRATVLGSSKELRPISQRSGCGIGSCSPDEDRISISPTELLCSKLAISENQTVRRNGSFIKASREDFPPQSQLELSNRIEYETGSEASEDKMAYSLNKLKLRKEQSTLFADFPDSETACYHHGHGDCSPGGLSNSETGSTCSCIELNDCSIISSMSISSESTQSNKDAKTNTSKKQSSLLSDMMRSCAIADEIPSRTSSCAITASADSMTDEMVKLPLKLKKSLARSSSDCANFQVDMASSSPSSSSYNAVSTRMASRARSLTDMDFQELQGCIDLGFRFDRSNIGELYNTLPALHVCCAVDKKLHDSSPLCQSPMSPAVLSPAKVMSPSSSSSAASTPSTLTSASTSASHTPTWRISSPGDDPNDVKGRLRHWAQAVACNVRLFY